KLSSGLQINRAGDDAAGLAISEKMRGQIRGLDMAAKNAQDGISLIQTAEGALNETHDILQRMRELTVQAGNEGTQEDSDLKSIKAEMDSLIKELGGEDGDQGIADRTQFNGKNLIDGTFATDKELTFQIGANGEQQLSVNIADMSAKALGTDSGEAAALALVVSDLDVTEFGNESGNMTFDKQLAAIDAAIGQVSSTRSELGAVQTRLEHTINNLGASSENLP